MVKRMKPSDFKVDLSVFMGFKEFMDDMVNTLSCKRGPRHPDDAMAYFRLTSGTIATAALRGVGPDDLSRAMEVICENLVQRSEAPMYAVITIRLEGGVIDHRDPEQRAMVDRIEAGEDPQTVIPDEQKHVVIAIIGQSKNDHAVRFLMEEKAPGLHRVTYKPIMDPEFPVPEEPMVALLPLVRDERLRWLDPSREN